MDERLAGFAKLLDIMDELRTKCPWDKKQTFESLRHLTIEETYELADAIIEGNLDEIKKELGDLMLHLVFYARIGSESGAFDMAGVLEDINQKLINRHPHIFGNVVAHTDEQVKENWEKIKLKEGKKRVLSGVPNSLPAMIKAYRIQEKARGVGFDWQNPDQVWEKVIEELEEFRQEAAKPDNHKKTEDEFGDLLFALINYSRFVEVNPEIALERTNKKFISRFEYIEEQAKRAGKELKKMNLSEMDVFWNKAKNNE
ncbi:MAG TPA: nucleoside triphosphate pyrophosphohydrolase [Bacteroidales bacterium]|nr:nucleoside triphosphate pyrophosphohydrolase [Bacteroidales bacterium]